MDNLRTRIIMDKQGISLHPTTGHCTWAQRHTKPKLLLLEDYPTPWRAHLQTDSLPGAKVSFSPYCCVDGGKIVAAKLCPICTELQVRQNYSEKSSTKSKSLETIRSGNLNTSMRHENHSWKRKITHLQKCTTLWKN